MIPDSFWYRPLNVPRIEGLKISISTSPFGRTPVAWFVKRRAADANYSYRAFTTCAILSWESEELDERPHALFLTAARKSLGSCQLGDTMEARPKQFRYDLWLRALPLKQLQDLGKCESQL